MLQLELKSEVNKHGRFEQQYSEEASLAESVDQRASSRDAPDWRGIAGLNSETSFAPPAPQLSLISQPITLVECFFTSIESFESLRFPSVFQSLPKYPADQHS